MSGLRFKANSIGLVVVILALSGCHAVQHAQDTADYHHLKNARFPTAPKELQKTVLPPYVIEPPDVLVIEATQVIPRQPYSLRTLDVVSIEARGVLPDVPINGAYRVEPGGVINLGLPYGQVRVVGMTPDQVEQAITEYLSERFAEPQVSVNLLEMAAMQQILGEHLVAMDGTVSLGTYGKVLVAGLSTEQARFTLEQHLSRFLDKPELAVDVFAYNSKKYYIVSEGAGLGDSVQAFSITGNETVLDAISNVNGLTSVSSKRIWVARPSPDNCEVQILPVDWKAISAYGMTDTNYQLLPGDRVFIEENHLIAFDNNLAVLLAPLERMMGFSILGATTATRLSGNVLQGGGNRNNGFNNGTGF